jgi:hypothetical protein
MTVFDRLEAQLLDAHPQRARRHLAFPAPRRMVAFAAAAAAVAAIAVAALSAGSSSNSATPAAQPGDAVPAVVRSQTTVAVLNATGTPGVARRAAKELADRGWRIGRVTNAPDQALKSSCVEFNPGHSQAATMISKDLGIHNVVPPAADVRAVAGRDADVIVLVGADRAR